MSRLIFACGLILAGMPLAQSGGIAASVPIGPQLRSALELLQNVSVSKMFESARLASEGK